MTRFPHLNAVRFYAAICVVILHVRLFLSVEGNAGLDRLLLGGWDSVTLFFVLSGFLITYRLLAEKTSTGDISLRKFYIRRALRILPLYYLVFFIGFLLSNIQSDYAIEPGSVIALLLLSGQFPYAWANGAGMGLLFHFWSLGVEEWFYALWPQFMKRLNPLTAIGIFFFGSIAVAALFFPATLFDRIEGEGVITLIRLCRFESMAVGAFGAWIILKRSSWLKYFYWLNIPAFAALAFLIFRTTALPGLAGDLFLEIVVMICLVNWSTNPRPILWLENRVTHYLGELSYGIYTLHPIVLMITGLLLRTLNVILPELILIVLGVLLTTLVAAISYQYFERPFLRAKVRFAAVSPASAV